MNYLIKIIILLLILTTSSYSNSNYNEKWDNKIIFEVNNKPFTRIDLERRISYLEQLNNTGYFKNIEINKFNNSLNIKLEEYPLFKNVEFKKNKRFKKDDLLKIFREANEFNIYNEFNINNTLDQYYNLYKSFG